MAKELVDQINDLVTAVTIATAEGKAYWKEGDRIGDYAVRANAGRIVSSDKSLAIYDHAGRLVELVQAGEDSMLDHNCGVLRKVIVKSIQNRKVDLDLFLRDLTAEFKLKIDD